MGMDHRHGFSLGLEMFSTCPSRLDLEAERLAIR